MSITTGVYGTSYSEEIMCKLEITSDKHGLVLEGYSASRKPDSIDFVLGLPFGVILVFVLLALKGIEPGHLKLLWRFYQQGERFL